MNQEYHKCLKSRKGYLDQCCFSLLDFFFKQVVFGVFYLHTWKENWKNSQILYYVLVTVFSCGEILCHGNKIKSSTIGSKDFLGKRAPKLQYFEEKKFEVIIFIQYIPKACQNKV